MRLLLVPNQNSLQLISVRLSLFSLWLSRGQKDSLSDEGRKIDPILIRLVDATTGGHLWAERYDRDLRDIFALQDEVTQKIVAALAVRLTEGEQDRLTRKYTDCQSRPSPVEGFGAESDFNH